jgi:hypothetical protein
VAVQVLLLSQAATVQTVIMALIQAAAQEAQRVTRVPVVMVLVVLLVHQETQDHQVAAAVAVAVAAGFIKLLLALIQTTVVEVVVEVWASWAKVLVAREEIRGVMRPQVVAEAVITTVAAVAAVAGILDFPAVVITTTGLMAVVVAQDLFVLFGQVQTFRHGHTHQLIQVTCDEIVYSS